MDHGRSIGAGIDAGFTAHTPMRVRDHRLGFGDPFSRPRRADGDAGSLRAVLTHDGHVNSDLPPFLHLNPGEGGARGPFVRQAADQFAGLATGAEVWQDRNGAHFNFSLWVRVVLYSERSLLNKS